MRWISGCFTSDHVYLSRWEVLKLLWRGHLKQEWCPLEIHIGKAPEGRKEGSGNA